MKKIVVTVALLMGGLIVFGQDLDEINEMLGKLEYRKAKDGIDKYLSDPKNAAKADGWYYKGRVYNSLSRDAAVPSAEVYQLKQDAFEAFKKYQEQDPKDLRFKLENYASYMDLYNGFYDLGQVLFGKKEYAAAANAFKTGLKVEDHIRSKGYEYNGFKFPVLDTSLLLNTAISLRQAQNEAEAVVYYKKLADANLNTEQYLDVYLYLFDHYAKANDNASLQMIIDKGKQLYPATDWASYAVDLELDKLKYIKDKKILVDKLQGLKKQHPNNFFISYYYASELYNSIYFAEEKPADINGTKEMLYESLKSAIALANKDEVNDANILMSHYLYNTAIDYNDSAGKYRSPKPDAVKKAKAFKDMYNQKLDEVIPYTEAVTQYFSQLPQLKASQKANYKLMLQRLSELYGSKGNTAKKVEYESKIKEVDKM